MCITAMIHRFRGVLSCRPTYPYPPRADVKLHRGGKRVCSNRFARAFARIAACTRVPRLAIAAFSYETRVFISYPTDQFHLSRLFHPVNRRFIPLSGLWICWLTVNKIIIIDFVFASWNWLDRCRFQYMAELENIRFPSSLFFRKDSLKFCSIKEKKLRTKFLRQNLSRLESIFQCKQFRYRSFKAQFWNS